jgi:hypothetical protein
VRIVKLCNSRISNRDLPVFTIGLIVGPLTLHHMDLPHH